MKKKMNKKKEIKIYIFLDENAPNQPRNLTGKVKSFSETDRGLFIYLFLVQKYVAFHLCSENITTHVLGLCT